MSDELRMEKSFMAEFYKGLMPRKFNETGDDRIIYEEENEVAEMYFIIKGFIGIGYNFMSGSIREDKFVMAKKQKGR